MRELFRHSLHVACLHACMINCVHAYTHLPKTKLPNSPLQRPINQNDETIQAKALVLQFIFSFVLLMFFHAM